MGRDDGGALEVFTIGHSNHSIERFVEMLKDNEIAVVVDIRSVPFSRYVPHFNGDRVAGALEAAGIAYLYAGDALGGRTGERAARSGGLDVGSPEFEAGERFREGIDNLTGVLASVPGRVAIMCAEEEPSRCHRARLLEPALADKGVRVIHIRAEGRWESNKSR